MQIRKCHGALAGNAIGIEPSNNLIDKLQAVPQFRIVNMKRIRLLRAFAAGFLPATRLPGDLMKNDVSGRLGNRVWVSCIGMLAAGLVSWAVPRAHAGLSRKEAETRQAQLWQERAVALKQERAGKVEARRITLGDKTMPWLEKVFGETPTNGRSLWVSMHGGGNATKAVNDQQWSNQIKLYQPAEGIYLAPRAPTDTWNLWHESHIDVFFDRLIEDFVAVRGVNPNRVYIMGYSAGGDGVWQLAPRMADRWAAAAMMAGHPNDAPLLPLRNLPFAAFVGGADSAYNRNTIVAERIAELDRLQKDDPGGYDHLGRVYPGLPHWMNGKDAEAVPWMLSKTRNPWPKKVVWVQSTVTHMRYYWLGVPAAEAKAGKKIIAEVSGQKIKLCGDVPQGMVLWLSDELLDLDNYVMVEFEGREIFRGRVVRTEEAIRESLAERADPDCTAKAKLVVQP
jgi:pimeloyl-ACP methyl ester carboxylesterase